MLTATLMTTLCLPSTVNTAAASKEAFAVQGVNLGGWLVLEPWITPSLFYSSLNRIEGNVAFDSYTFCEVMKK